MSYVYLNGKTIRAEKAAIGIDNRSFRYGDGFFETIKCIKGKLPLWEYHAQRLFKTLRVLRFVCPKQLTADALKESILEILIKNEHHRIGRVRITIFRGDGGLYDEISNDPNILIQTWDLNPQNNFLNENGLVAGQFSEGFKAADALANYKSNNYLLYAMAAMHAKQQHWNDALILNHNGLICDATIANVWIIRDNQIVTPRLEDGPVAGVMRQYLLEHLPTAGWTVMEGSITPETLKQADEIFLTNSIYGLKWVKEYENASFQWYQATRIYANVLAPLWTATI